MIKIRRKYVCKKKATVDRILTCVFRVMSRLNKHSHTTASLYLKNNSYISYMELSKIEKDELKHIYRNQPVWDGDTLGGSTKRSLKKLRLIESDGKGNNYTTPLGNKVYHTIK
jgi:hypothetical protein